MGVKGIDGNNFAYCKPSFEETCKNLNRLVANLIQKAKRAFANAFAPMSLQTATA